jgi:hypothetical protein
MAVTMKDNVFWYFILCGSCKNVTEELSASIIRVTKIQILCISLERASVASYG